jgi:YggT family protein
MFIFGDLLIAIAKIIDTVLTLYMYILIITVLISWVNPDPYNTIVRLLYSITEPALRPVRRLIGYRLGPIDISPLVVILVIIFIQSFLVRSLIKLGYKLGGG